jgi:phosphoglycerate dehydrogenase-like enzyme
MPYVVAFEDFSLSLSLEDFDPLSNVTLVTYPTIDHEKAYNYELKDYMQIKNPEKFEIAVVRKNTICKDYLDYFCNLKFVHITSAGIDGLDINSLKERGIVLANVTGLYSGHMAEDVIMRMIFMTRRMFEVIKQQQNKEWKLISPLGALFDATVTTIGAGSIAIEIAKRLKAFNTKVIAVAQTARKSEFFENVYGIEDIKKAVEQADFVVCCLPQTANTNNIINRDLFNCMKDGVYFINVGRGNCVDETALLDAMNSGKVAAASCDVFQTEPLPVNSPFWTQKNFLLTPHNSGGYYSGANLQRRKFIGRNISNFILEKPIDNKIV